MDLKKRTIDGTIEKYNEKHIVKGFKQQEYMEHLDTCPFVSSITSIQMLIIIINIKNFAIHQIDVSITFLEQHVRYLIKRQEKKCVSCQVII